MLTGFNSLFYVLLGVANLSVLCLLFIHRLRALQQRVVRLEEAQRRAQQCLQQQGEGLLLRLQDMESRLEHTARKQSQAAPQRQDTNLRQANKLLDLGIDTQQLAQSLGMSEAEAKLVSLMHSRQESNSQDPLQDVA